jgi:DNA-directed RNA polymerase specialized sigma24 family protein
MRPEVSFSFPSVIADEGPTLVVSEVATSSEDGVAPVDTVRLSALLHRHYGSVWRAVRRFGVPSEAAEDATQEVFIVASQKLATILEGQELRYLYGIALCRRRSARGRRPRRGARRRFAGTRSGRVARATSPA